MHFVCNHSYFGNIILACIMISSAMLAAEDPLQAMSERNKVSRIFSYILLHYFLFKHVFLNSFQRIYFWWSTFNGLFLDYDELL